MTINHGTLTAYKQDLCTCEPCRAANRRYVARRSRLILYGQWAPLTDAQPVREHVQALGAQGLGWKRTALLAGLSTAVLSKLLYGTPVNPPTKRVRQRTAAAILAVRADLDTLSPRAAIDAVGVRRRLQALVTNGWSQAQIAARLGMLPTNLTATIKAERVAVSTARAVRDLYNEMWDEVPPQVERRDQISFKRARNYAAARGWVPPMAWDDDTIDDPAAVPDLGAESSRSAALAEDADELIAQGYSPSDVAERLGTTRNAISHARSRVRAARAVNA